MYSVALSIAAPEQDNQAFQKAAATFVNDLRSVRDLDAKIPDKAVPGTRGFVELLSQIVVTGISVGAFTAIYTLAKDLYDRYATAEVELKFADGSTLKLKGLSYAQAEAKMREHLEKNKA
jgi:hypothetical protein